VEEEEEEKKEEVARKKEENREVKVDPRSSSLQLEEETTSSSSSSSDDNNHSKKSSVGSKLSPAKNRMSSIAARLSDAFSQETSDEEEEDGPEFPYWYYVGRMDRNTREELQSKKQVIMSKERGQDPSPRPKTCWCGGSLSRRRPP
jgi:hypothetical protein